LSRKSDPLHIVAIGGGTGLSALLRGLKQYAPHAGGDSGEDPGRTPEIDITAVVTVTDDGGSSGRLRRELDILPPGDIRNCMVALSEDEGLLSRLFQHRFDAGRSLKGHSFGNLFLSAMTQLTGDFAQAVALSSEVLATRGRIFPSTATNVSLEGWLEDGTGVAGETKISRSRTRIRRIALKPRRVLPLPETLDAIERAGIALHKHRSQPVGARNSRGIACGEGADRLFRKPDVAAGRDDELQGKRSREGDPASFAAGPDRLRSSEHAAGDRSHAAAVRGGARVSRGERRAAIARAGR
jgi:hypothetical protein